MELMTKAVALLQNLPYKNALSIAAIALTFLATLPYIISILKGKTKPHVFTWVIWGSTTFIVFLAQLQSQAGMGAWPVGVSGVLTIVVAVLAMIKRADISISKSDWGFLLVAASALPLWYITADPLWAVVILTLVDVLGFGPTLRKLYHQPYSEPMVFYALFVVRNILVILALEHYSLATVFFPAVLAGCCIVIIGLMAVRRRASGRQQLLHFNNMRSKY